MAEKLIIWIADDIGRERRADVHWLVLDANGNRDGFPQSGPVATAATFAANRHIVVMLPGERIVAAAARIPGNPRRILQAAPYALEDRLAGDVDALHVALLARGEDQQCDFLVVERAWFAECLEALRTAGIRVDEAWPDYLGVPAEPGTVHWLVVGGRVLSHEGWSGFAAAVEDIEFLHARRDSDSPLHITLADDQPLPGPLAELIAARIDRERAFTELARGIAALRGHGLLQGAFRQKRDEQTNWRRWRWPAIAAGVWLALALTSLGLDAWRLEREYALLEQAAQDLFQQALPGSRLVKGEERYLIERALGAASATADSPLGYVADVAGALQNVPNARLNGFNYRENRFEMSVTVPDATTLETLRDALAQRAGQPVDVQSANSTREGLEGRLLLAAGSAQ